MGALPAGGRPQASNCGQASGRLDERPCGGAGGSAAKMLPLPGARSCEGSLHMRAGQERPVFRLWPTWPHGTRVLRGRSAVPGVQRSGSTLEPPRGQPEVHPSKEEGWWRTSCCRLHARRTCRGGECSAGQLLRGIGQRDFRVGSWPGRGEHGGLKFFPPLVVLQGNLNRCRAAQNLLMQTLAERSVALAIVAEPHSVPDHPRWFGVGGGSVAIFWAGGERDPHCSLVRARTGSVFVEWGPAIVVGCYVSPNSGLAAFEAYLDGLASQIRAYQSRPVFVLGDFNAHSRVWGDARDDLRGETLLEWAAGLDLRLLNRGSVSTCVRWQGESIVDLSWATPSAAHLVSGWHVISEEATLSDHRHIVFRVASSRPDSSPEQRSADQACRWNIRRMDADLLAAVAHVSEWEAAELGIPPDPEAQADWFRGVMTRACDASMPRTRSRRPRSQYWWCAETAQARAEYVRARRQHLRARRRRRATQEERSRVHEEYRVAVKSFRVAIAEAKARSWRQLVEGLDRDPWGRPYRMVMGKLRPWVPPLTSTLDPDFLGGVINTLFPRVQGSPSTPPSPSSQQHLWDDEFAVTEEELDRAVRRLGARNTAPGPDGIPGRAWVLALAILGDRLRQLFTDCLRCAVFPTSWKEADLILIQKVSGTADSPSAFRPICLLSEAGKLFERVIASRLLSHLSRVGPDLSDCQFGFRQGRSTIDAVLRVRSLSEPTVRGGGVALAVSLDIANAFNSLPWQAIRGALVHHNVPPYLRDIVGAYLDRRSIRYVGRNGTLFRRELSCGVPQGSVLGPLLWNLAYDAVLRIGLPPGVSVVCYADDTLVLARGTGFDCVLRLAEIGVACVVAAIGQLGLRVALHKTEALWFHRLPRGREPPSSSMRIGDAEVRVGRYVKYLGLTLDSRWSFEEHFERLAPRVRGAAGAIQRLLPNLGGPCEDVRRLYEGAVRSMALYGAPVWHHRLTSASRCRAILASLQRLVGLRIARGYRTISHEAAALLSRLPPWDLRAAASGYVFDESRRRREEEVVDLRTAGVDAVIGPPRRHGSRETLRDPLEVFRQNVFHDLCVEEWRARLSLPRSARQRIVEAVLPVFEAWLERRFCITYRLTQILTGHGCFGEYLSRIGREATAQCHHCGDDRDSAQHTLEVCPAWEAERRVLVAVIGRDLSLPAVVKAMAEGGDTQWNAVASFCEAVMLQKEAAERDRERADPARRRRRRRGGGNGR